MFSVADIMLYYSVLLRSLSNAVRNGRCSSCLVAVGSSCQGGNACRAERYDESGQGRSRYPRRRLEGKKRQGIYAAYAQAVQEKKIDNGHWRG